MIKTHYPKDPKGGSIKLKIVNPDLAEERAKLVFLKQDVSDVVEEPTWVALTNIYADDLVKHPEYKATEEWFDMTREEQMRHYWKRLAMMYKNNPDLHFTN